MTGLSALTRTSLRPWSGGQWREASDSGPLRAAKGMLSPVAETSLPLGILILKMPSGFRLSPVRENLLAYGLSIVLGLVFVGAHHGALRAGVVGKP